ncbi:MAG: hypothetical protein HDQ90_08565 [Desulfovibrio sp.]|nr:hypothetical protein [Desulfovibrio sp.]
MSMTENDTNLTTIPGWKTHMDTAQRILELEQQLKDARAENARLRTVLDDVDLETAVNSMTPGGYYVLTPGNWMAFRTRAEALEEAAGYGDECVALVIRVEERFDVGHAVVTAEEEAKHNGVMPGVDFPATLSRGAAARVA